MAKQQAQLCVMIAFVSSSVCQYRSLIFDFRGADTRALWYAQPCPALSAFNNRWFFPKPPNSNVDDTDAGLRTLEVVQAK